MGNMKTTTVCVDKEACKVSDLLYAVRHQEQITATIIIIVKRLRYEKSLRRHTHKAALDILICYMVLGLKEHHTCADIYHFFPLI